MHSVFRWFRTEVERVSSIEKLFEVMARLRDPARGCPWDLEQTFDSIAPHTIEEAQEVADAIARRDDEALVDELGDLLFQIVFYAQMGKEVGRFQFEDVVDAIVHKMIRRHPHVFGSECIEDPGDRNRAWERLKAAERPEGSSVMDCVPSGLTPAVRAKKLQRRAAGLGFDWRSAKAILPKLREEMEEMVLALDGEHGRETVAGELGDLLFTCINLARHLQIDADEALRKTNIKFERRFRRMEVEVAAEGRSLRDLPPSEIERCWEKVKASEDAV